VVVVPAGAAAAPFGDPVLFLMMGGFMLAEAMQKWGLHRRLALHTVRLIGLSPSRIILGFMAATGLLSMWMSNSATTVMMLPIAMSVIWRVQDLSEDEKIKPDPFAAALILSIAYAASIGGLATLVGTPPNAIFAGQMKRLFPSAPELFFDQWMKVGLPVSVVLMAAAWFLLTRVLFAVNRQEIKLGPGVLEEELAKLGPMTRGEKITLAVFLVTAGLWMSRGLWSKVLPAGVRIDDATIAMSAALALFFLPVDLKQRKFALDWKSARGIPWGVLFLFGGGFCLAAGLEQSGFAKWAGQRLLGIQGVPAFVHVMLVCLLMTFLTEVTSNTAVTTIMVPIMAFTAVSLHLHPCLLMVPATLSASCAFMLPSATPPNAIVIGAGAIRLPQMAKTGLVLNGVGVLVITLAVYFLGGWALGMDLSTFPPWAGLDPQP
jgi:sodium-dependent dicarboxylate transporter 2/3/5